MSNSAQKLTLEDGKEKEEEKMDEQRKESPSSEALEGPENQDLSGLVQTPHSPDPNSPQKDPLSTSQSSPIERVEEFEPLQEYSASHFPPSPFPGGGEPLTPPLEEHSELPAMQPTESDFPLTNPFEGGPTGGPPAQDSESLLFDTSSFGSSSLNVEDLPSAAAPEAMILAESEAGVGPTAEAQADSTIGLETPSTATAEPEAASAAEVGATAKESQLTLEQPTTSAAFPFSVLIHGPLSPMEKEKLLDLLSRHNMGIREIDLESQWNSGRILIPRISEYAAVLIIQGLRAIQGRIEVGPSDMIFSTEDTRTETLEESSSSKLKEKNQSAIFSDFSHPAEALPVTPGDRLPNFPRFEVIDTVMASAALQSKWVEVGTSPEYNEMVESLKKELKYKAYRKGASAIVQFKMQLIHLSSPSYYRLQATGVAIRPVSS